MTMSLSVSPHAFSVVEVDYANVDNTRAKTKDEFKSAEGFSLTYLPFISRAVVDALADFPHMNASISGTDLIVGARSGQVNLLLYSVFRIGNPTNNVGWDSYQAIKTKPGVAWTIPLSLGDYHKGFRVLGTNGDYFTHLKYGQQQSLQLREGRPFETPFEAVLGAQVAQKLGYKLDQPIVIAHGAGNTSFSQHDNLPFKVVGILAPTGTPIDRTIHVPLAGIEAIHLGWDTGRHSKNVTAEQALAQDLTPKTITAFMVGLSNRILAFQLQRTVQCCLATHGWQHGTRPLFLNNFLYNLPVNWLDIGSIGHFWIGHNGRWIRVHQNNAKAFFF